MKTGRIVSLAMIVFLVVLVNTPYLHGRYVAYRLDRQGVDVTMTVLDHREQGGDHDLQLSFPSGIEAGQAAVVRRVSAAAYDDAVAAGTIAGRTLPDDPDQLEVDGQLRSRVPLFFTLFADAAIAALIVLFLRFRVAMRPELVLRATGDLEACEAGAVLERIVGNQYVVAGALRSVEGDEVVLDLGDRLVRVVLDGHANPVGHEEPVRVVGVMIG